MKSNWAFTLHVKHPNLYLPVLESQIKRASEEVAGLCRLLKRFNIVTNSKILDYSCGIGRHSILFAKKRYSVIGYDSSPYYLKIANDNASKLIHDPKMRPKFILGDAYKSSNTLKKNKGSDFDAIIVMDNCFGYSKESNDIIMLKELLKVANERCVLIMETENRDWRLSNFEPSTFFDSKEIEIHSTWNFDFESSVSQGVMRFFEKKHQDDHNLNLRLKLKTPMRLYSLHEMRRLIEKSGWKYKESYDDISSLKPFTNSSMSIFSVSTIK